MTMVAFVFVFAFVFVPVFVVGSYGCCVLGVVFWVGNGIVQARD
jgi:hypothetical protein